MCSGSACPRASARSAECASSSTKGTIATAASALPASRPATSRPTARSRARAVDPRQREQREQAAGGEDVEARLRVPAEELHAPRRAPARRPAARPGRRTTPSTASSSHGSHAHTLLSGHVSHTTKNSPNANTIPASSAPANRAPERARRAGTCPSPRVNSFSPATIPSDHQNGSISVGHVNGENSADCALATNGRPPMMCGFHSGTSGSGPRAHSANGWKTSTASACS